MSHSTIFVVKRAGMNDTCDLFKTDEEALFESLSHIADYVDEYDKEKTGMLAAQACSYLQEACGRENVTMTSNGTFKVTRAGIVQYFTQLLKLLSASVKTAQERPIEEFIGYGMRGWYGMKDLIETSWGLYWKYEDTCPLPTTSFLQDLYLGGQDEYELELVQAFDYHC